MSYYKTHAADKRVSIQLTPSGKDIEYLVIIEGPSIISVDNFARPQGNTSFEEFCGGLFQNYDELFAEAEAKVDKFILQMGTDRQR